MKFPSKSYCNEYCMLRATQEKKWNSWQTNVYICMKCHPNKEEMQIVPDLKPSTDKLHVSLSQFSSWETQAKPKGLYKRMFLW